MSDYVNTADQASFDGLGMDSVPFSYDFDQPTKSDHLDNIDWANPDYEDLARIDWRQLHDEIMQEVFEDPAAELQPGDGYPPMHPDSSPEDCQSNPMLGLPYLVQSHHVSPIEQVSASSRPGPDKYFVCDMAGCARPFKRLPDLRRHSKKHGAQQKYDCLAVDCTRTGERGFVRRDKLVDHMLAGHDEHALFSCLACGVKLPRGLFAIHNLSSAMYPTLDYYRTCPLRCSFKVYACPWKTADLKNMDKLQHHLLEKHDLKERVQYINLLEQRGYDARTCEVICLVCTSKCRFFGHEEFAEHFMQAHYFGPACGMHDSDRSCLEDCPFPGIHWRLSKCTSITDQVRRHRCSILGLWPSFYRYPVWEDIKCPGTSA